MVRLDPLRPHRIVARALDHVRVEGALGQEVHPGEPAGLGFEDGDEGRPDLPPLLLRIDHALEGVQERILGVGAAQRNAEVTVHDLLDPAPFVPAEQTVVHEKAGQLAWYRAMDQSGADRGVDASRQGAEHVT